MLNIKLIRLSGWKIIASGALILNFIFGFILFELIFTQKHSINSFETVKKLSLFNNQKIVLSDLLTFVIIDFENFENDLSDTIDEICSQIPNLNFLIITENIPYPPILFKNNKNKCKIKIVTSNPDPTKNLYQTRPENFISTEFVLFIPDSTRISANLLLASLKVSHIKEKQIIAIPVMHQNEDIDYLYQCYKLNFDVKRWTLTYYLLKNEHQSCEALDGDFAFFIKKEDLFEFNQPFMKPFALSLYIQSSLKNFNFIIDDDLKFERGISLYTDTKNENKRLSFEEERKINLFKNLGIKKVVKNNQTFMYGCHKNSFRCFTTIYQDTPEYLISGKWTPPCCLENLKIVFHRVIKVLEFCKVRYWLEGGTLLGAIRNSSIIPWDYDIDLGIYKEDINKCEILKLASVHPVKDDENFLWEKAREGEFLRINYSPQNRLHVDIFPFYSKRGMMTKETWFDDHPQDKEFPEKFLKPMEKILFLDREAFIPNNAKDFLEFKFGKNVIEKPEYPNPKLLKKNS